MGEPSGADLARRALEVLDHNRRGEWTCPADGIYPNQWLWDSCFIAIGLARHDPQRAAGELRALFRGQWANGMLPHMIFAAGSHDAGSARIWRSRSFPEAPRDVETSCITQPPLPAVAAEHIANAMAEADRRPFLEEIVPEIVRYHEWLYRARDLGQRGLVTLIHPWECGLDTTPPWMTELGRMREPRWMRAVMRWHLAHVVRFLRRDTRYVPACERPSEDDGLRMLVLAHRARRYGFDLRRMPPADSVLVEDLAFNAILVAANRSLVRIAAGAGIPIGEHLQRCCARSAAALDELWDESKGEYFSRNATTGAPLGGSTVATFLPLWAASSTTARTARLVARLSEPGWWPRFPVPSVPTDAPEFDAERYWKGPTWVNTNWMIIEGLAHHGEQELADELRRRTLALVAASGFSEYFSPTTGHGDGAGEFSWTAALVLDLATRAPRSPE
ncbi:MAG: MGH1-like glycoside hydrolase domain-containing protein [Acidimicrobiia bacterium]